MSVTPFSPVGTAAGARQPDLLAAAGRLVPTLAEQAEKGERLRRVTDEAAQALRAAGMFRLGTPSCFGGYSAGVRTCMEVTAELARGDASSAWIAMVYTGGSLIAGLMDERAQEEVWGADSDAALVATLTPSGSSVAVDGAITVSGRWGFASGVDHAQWAVLAVAPAAADQPPLIVLVPLADLTVEDTWHVAGMAGTGSNTLVADEVLVPAHRIINMGGVLAGAYAEHAEEARFRVATSSQLALTVVAPMLGMARAALELTIRTAQRKPMSLTTYPRLADSPSVQLAVADAASLIDTAHLHAYRAADDLDRAAEAGRQLTVAERARVRMDTGVAAVRSREAVDRLVSVNGAGGFAMSNPLQRIWRDIGTASRHGVVNPDLGREIYGRSVLGIDEQPTFII
ncbi:acyl-CoA dehydrogenase family protein [Nocardia sp. NPDC050175]|uniref:acyl-CoA dehydrogenase family protein n=1 Tax=Nocardia sp. NPDC050175 TaxID=3364317 RepID=UPI0037A96DE3